MNSTAVKPPVAPTKLCHLIKRPDFEGYGFNLHSEKIKPGQFIGKIDGNSPAEAAGLKKGDRIIEVNGVPINNETHKQVVQRIKAIENEVRLLLIDVDGNNHHYDGQINENKQQQIITTTTTTNSSMDEQNNNNNNDEEKDVVDNHNKIMQMPESMQRNSTNSNISRDSNQQMNTTTNNLNSNGNNNSHNNNNNSNNNNLSQNDLPLNNNNNNNNIKTTTNGSHNSATTTSTTTNTLQLPLTAAEMRAKLMSKKKYDPKSESVDIKKKFQIIQTL